MGGSKFVIGNQKYCSVIIPLLPSHNIATVPPTARDIIRARCNKTLIVTHLNDTSSVEHSYFITEITGTRLWLIYTVILSSEIALKFEYTSYTGAGSSAAVGSSSSKLSVFIKCARKGDF